MHFFGISGLRPLLYCTHLVYIGCYPFTTDSMTQVRQLLLSKRTLGDFDFPLIPSEELQHLAQMNQMVFPSFAKH